MKKKMGTLHCTFEKNVGGMLRKENVYREFLVVWQFFYGNPAVDSVQDFLFACGRLSSRRRVSVAPILVNQVLKVTGVLLSKQRRLIACLLKTLKQHTPSDSYYLS